MAPLEVVQVVQLTTRFLRKGKIDHLDFQHLVNNWKFLGTNKILFEPIVFKILVGPLESTVSAHWLKEIVEGTQNILGF